MSAQVAVAFHGLTAAEDLDAGNADAPSVSPALPTILRALADRDIDATFFLTDAVREAEPLAVTMIRNARHAAGDIAEEPDATVADRDGPGDVHALHQELQLAVAAALRDGELAVLMFTPGLLERTDALAVFVETLELVEGLREAGSLEIRTLA